jgi:hypothetical protein
MVTRRKLALGIVLVGGWLLLAPADTVGNPPGSTDSVAVARQSDAMTVHLGAGRAGAAFTTHRPQGEITQYQIRAPEGARVRATMQIPGVTTRLAITTGAPSDTGACHTARGSITCTTGEEGCPMPVATWHVVVRKLAGPPGDVTVWFRIGQPAAVRAA